MTLEAELLLEEVVLDVHEGNLKLALQESTLLLLHLTDHLSDVGEVLDVSRS